MVLKEGGGGNIKEVSVLQMVRWSGIILALYDREIFYKTDSVIYIWRGGVAYM